MMSSATAYEQMAKQAKPLTWEKPKILAMGLTYDEIELWLKTRGFRTDTPKSTIHRWIDVWWEIGYIIPFRNEDDKQQFIWRHIPTSKAKIANSLAYEKGYNPIYDSYLGTIDNSLYAKTLELARANGGGLE